MTRRERQPAKSPASRGSGVSVPGGARQRNEPDLVRLFTWQERLKPGMVWGVAALMVASLFMTGLAWFSGGKHTERATLPGEQRALTKSSMPAHGGSRENTNITIPQAGQQGPATRAQAAIPTEKIISIAASPAADLPPVEAATSPELVSVTAHDGSEINGFEAGQEEVAMVAPNRLLPNIESTDAPAADGGAGKMVVADDPPVVDPVSREEKIATLLAQGRQSLRRFRLLTPAGDNANQYFKEVLALDPGNSDARDGFKLIAEQYVIMVRRANERHDSKLARLYISRGLRVQPGNTDLLALQDSMRKPPVTARETAAEVSPVVEVSPPAVEPPPEQQPGVFSRLRTLFTGKREEPAEVVERSIMSVNP